MSYDNWNGYFYHNENQVVQIENATILSQCDDKQNAPLSLKSNSIEWTHASYMSNLHNEVALEKEYALFLEEIGKINRIDKNNYEYASFIEEIGNINCIEKNDCNAYVTYARESFICTDSLIICNDNTSSCCEVEDMDISSDDESSNSVTIINNNNIDYSNKNKEIESSCGEIDTMVIPSDDESSNSVTIINNNNIDYSNKNKEIESSCGEIDTMVIPSDDESSNSVTIINNNNIDYSNKNKEIEEEFGNINGIEKNYFNAYGTYTRESFICTDSLIICNDNTPSCGEIKKPMVIPSDDKSSNSVTIINNNNNYSNKIKEIEEEFEHINRIQKNDFNVYGTYARESFICTDSLIICNDNTSSCCEVEDMDISSDDESSNSVTIINNNNIDYSNKNKEIEDELDNLLGMKCQAPFKYGFSRTILCNAVIISFTLETTTFPMSLDNVLVTVLFLNPTSNPMVPCRYWAGNKCMYSDQDCEFSHGTQIPLTSIANYIEPNYEHLRRGSLVLANTFKNCLWSKAVVLDIEYGTSINNGTCVVRYSTNGLGVAKVPMHDIYPWVNKYEFVDYNNMGKIFGRKETKLGSEESLGDWEKYTKGIGSKIMAKMGYIKGTGLGKNNEGRVKPVVATVLPKRQSLDYCIAVENKNHRTYLQKKPKKLICFERSVE